MSVPFVPNQYQPQQMGPPSPPDIMGPPSQGQSATATMNLANTMMNLEQSQSQQLESSRARETAGAMVSQLAKQNEIAPHWTGALAAGIRGYAMRKHMKTVDEATKSEAAATARSAELTRQAEREKEERDWERKKDFEVFKNNMKEDKFGSVIEYEDAGFDLKARPPETLNDQERLDLKSFDLYLDNKNRRAATQGTGSLDLGSTAKNQMETAIMTGLSQEDTLQRIDEAYDPSYFGMGADIKAKYGKMVDYTQNMPFVGSAVEALSGLGGVTPEDAKAFFVKRDNMMGSVKRLTNQILLERSGAAVTAPEFERFKAEFPVGRFVGAEEFRGKIQRVINDIMSERESLLRTGGYTVDPLSGGLRKLRQGEVPSYGRHVLDLNQPAQSAPPSVPGGVQQPAGDLESMSLEELLGITAPAGG